MAIKRKFFAPPGIISNEASFVFSALDSTSITTGALQVIGGAGVGKTFNIGGNFNLWNGNFYTGFRSSASSNITYLLPQTTPATGTSVLQSDSSGTLTWAPMTVSGTSSTSSYADQSGYGITSGLASTANYSLQSGYGITSGLASTANYSLQSGYGITSGLATTANYSLQSGYGITSGLASTANYSLQSGYGITSGLATTASNIDVRNATANSAHFIHLSPIANGSGLATSSSSTLSYNPSLLVLSASGISVTSATISNNSSSGALTVSGGVGIGGSLSISGRIQLFNGSNYTSIASSASSNTLYTLPSSAPSTGTSVLQSDTTGILNWVPMTAATAATSIFSSLTILGSASVGQTLTVENFIVNGTITSAYQPGDIIKMSAFNASDLSMNSISINSYSYTEIGSTTFTPKSSNSYLIFEFNVNYYIDSLTVANDDFYSQITVDGSEIVFSRQIFEIGQSGGTRSGVLFPLFGRYTNSSSSSKTISIKAKRGNTDDNLIIVANSVSGFLRVTEVAR